MNNNSTINERIYKLIENQYNSNQKKFADCIGFKAQVVFNIVSGRKSKPSFDVLSAIISTNDDLNIEWLMTGKGEMLKSNELKEYPIKENTTIDYKELADARKETIESQKIAIESQKNEIIAKDDKIYFLESDNIRLKQELANATRQDNNRVAG